MKMSEQNTFRRLILLIGICIAVFSFIMTGCDDKVEVTQKYTRMEPVYISTEELRASFDIMPPVEVTNTGKIYLYQDYILLNEPGKGVHIIDNKNKEQPDAISFVKIPGNYEMAVQGDRLFADSYVDLVVIDISDPSNVKLTKRIEDIFLDLAVQNQYYDVEKGIITDWEPKEIVEVHESEFNGSFPSYYYYETGIALRGGFANMDMALSSFAPESAPVMSTGIGGSMARFTIMKNHLYSISNSNMQVFDITNLDEPVPGANLNIGWGIETIFPYKDNLFIGSQSGMIIYDNTDPDLPTHLSTFSHIVSCDPVVVEDDLAYVTLRGGTGCRNNFTNQLDVIDISDLKNPKLLVTHPMTNPHGLGIDNGILFLCEGKAGLKVFDASDIYKIPKNLLAYYGDMDAFDVIPYNNNLIMIGNDGLYQFDYSDPENIKLLSSISINREQSL
ncbi:MAG: hypothetical protein MI975_10865 [Cytophagales bacterium]|nr:hypothetical protein [Cytophagales bacterium]